MTEVPTDEGKLYLATVIDLYSRRLLAAPTSVHLKAELAMDAIKMAVAVHGDAKRIRDVFFHTGRGSTSTATGFTTLCAGLHIRQSMGRVGHASTTQRPSRCSPPRSGRSWAGITFAPRTKPDSRSAPGSTSPTTPGVDTAVPT